jgi:hypothetical protein
MLAMEGANPLAPVSSAESVYKYDPKCLLMDHASFVAGFNHEQRSFSERASLMRLSMDIAHAAPSI